MSEVCLIKSCKDCDFHVMVRGKLDCNYMNRLGLAEKATLKSYVSAETEKEVLEGKLKKAIEEVEEMKKALEEVK